MNVADVIKTQNTSRRAADQPTELRQMEFSCLLHSDYDGMGAATAFGLGAERARAVDSPPMGAVAKWTYASVEKTPDGWRFVCRWKAE